MNADYLRGVWIFALVRYERWRTKVKGCNVFMSCIDRNTWVWQRIGGTLKECIFFCRRKFFPETMKNRMKKKKNKQTQSEKIQF